MIYQYRCHTCRSEIDIIKPVSEIEHREFCIDCGSLMKRVDIHRHVFVRGDSFQPHYNYAFGKMVNNKRDLKNEVSRHNGEHGTDLIEVGNENYKPKRASRTPDYRQAIQELKKMRGK